MKKYIVVILFFLIGQVLSAQDLPVVIPKSPEAAALSKYSEFPVGTFTGIPSIALPLYTIESGDIKLPVELNYHSGGFRVSEEASWVGLGWSLSTSALITREVHGEDDFTGGHSFLPYITNIPMIDPVGFNGFAGSERLGGYSEQRTSGPAAIVNGIYTPNYSGTNTKLDWEPDIFTISCFGLNGKFVLDQNGTPNFLEKTDLNVKHTDKGWSISTSDGFHYYFETSSKTTDYLGYDVSGSWYLTKIISPSGDSVILNYVDNPVQSLTTSYSEYSSKIYSDNSQSYIIDKKFTGTRFVEKYLNEIVFKYGSLKFDTLGRKDLENGKRLSVIKVRNKNNQVVKEIKFYTDYFNSNQNSGYLSGVSTIDYSCYFKRLRLNAVTIKNGSDSAQYKFSYSNINLPNKDSYNIDHWGYYNGASNTKLIPSFEGELPYERFYHQFIDAWGAYHMQTSYLSCLESASIYKRFVGADRNPNKATMGACLLEKITYPTGGCTLFKFEPNEYGNPEIQNQVEQYTYSNFTATIDILCSQTGDPLITQTVPFPYTFPEDVVEITNPEIQMVVMPWNVTDYSKCISLTSANWFDVDLGGKLYWGETTSYYHRYYFNDLDNDINTTPECNITSHTANLTGQLSKFTGPLSLDIHIDPNQIHENKRAIITFTCRVKKRIVYSPTAINFGGGLRVKSIKYYNGLDSVKNIVKTYSYTTDFTDAQGVVTTKSSGILKIPFKYYTIKRNIPQENRDAWTDILFTASNMMNLTYGQYSNIGYSRVTEITSSAAENGKIIYNYKNYANDCFIHPYRPAGVPNTSQWLPFDGKLLDKTVYNNAGQIVSKTTYDYELKDEKIIKGIFQDGFNFAWGFLPYQKIGSGCLHYYPIFCRWEALSGTQEYLYNSNDITNYVKNVTSYSYNGKNHIQPTTVSTLTSEDVTKLQLNKYAGDYAFSDCDESYNQCELDYQTDLNECMSNYWNEYAYMINSPNYSNCHDKYIEIEEYCNTQYSIDYANLKKRYYNDLMDKYNNDTTWVGQKLRQLALVKKFQCTDNGWADFQECKSIMYDTILTKRESCTKSVENNYTCAADRKNCIDSYENHLTGQAKIISDLGRVHPAALVESVKMKAGKVLEADLNLYGYAGNTGAGKTVLPVEARTLKTLPPSTFTPSSYKNYAFDVDPQYEERMKMTYYNDGHLKEAWKTDNIVTTYLWANNISYPVVKIEGIKFSDITDTPMITRIFSNSYTSNTDKTSVDADVLFLKGQLSAYISDPRYMVTIYTYSPLFGITSQTDSNGVTTYYEYDGLGRLKAIKNDDGNILKTFDYHYKE
ncbi:MAG TPA: RHS repeat domain-containing protein [Bacteroidales bacterium]|nr:RHS repeat domain-containing protein [Bacteroidales bacterium]